MAGCGTAGLAAALLLHRDGHRVTLFERFDSPRPLGSGLLIQPTGQAVLRALGLEAELLARGARVQRLIGHADDRCVLDVRYAALKRGGIGIGVHRATLFAILHDAVFEEGIAIEAGQAITGCADGRLQFAVRASAGPFDLIVDAMGSRSPLIPAAPPLAFGALWADLDWAGDFIPDALQQHYRRASVMAGVLPIGTPRHASGPRAALFWSLRADRLADWRAAGLAMWKEQVLELWPATAPLLDQIADPQQLTFASYAHRTLRQPVADRLIHIGDAWHSTSPQLGQGANMALLDAYALALGLRRSRALPDALAETVRLRRDQIALYQLLSRVLTPVYQSDGTAIPWLRDRVMGPVSKLWPFTAAQAALVSGAVGHPLARLGLSA
ncbi:MULTISPECIES: NAD(P)/FAD-dependent oxidoreductase [unclassified Sphingomonas]|uniref:FAD-dependent oxidoreductase n=1 Tax=unclassified Sphingomonas TaxID=196159 RepID=UPI0027E2DAC8|nr:MULTISPECIES: NAD(P)/FAD-dependent oxidoreductase [unclassified Sphingomonas]